jgi:hypothetical protein
MPVLEVRYHGAKVVTINSPELREAGGVGVKYAELTEFSFLNTLLAAIKSENLLNKNDEFSWPSWRHGANIIVDHLLHN